MHIDATWHTVESGLCLCRVRLLSRHGFDHGRVGEDGETPVCSYLRRIGVTLIEADAKSDERLSTLRP